MEVVSARKRLSVPTNNWDLNTTKKARQSNKIREEPKIVLMAGVKIPFPNSIDPYPTQRLMMFRIMQSLKRTNTRDFKQHNALIESPTGSGKTLALLSASCAWLKEYKNLRAESKANCRLHSNIIPEKVATADNRTVTVNNKAVNGSARENFSRKTAKDAFNKSNKFDDSLASLTTIYDTERENSQPNTEKEAFNKSNELEDLYTINDDEADEERKSKMLGIRLYLNTPASSSTFEKCTCLPAARIYYGTRTHKQISQVVKEFGRLQCIAATPLKHTILGSRDQTCINQRVRDGYASRENSTITSRCKDLLDRIGCMHRIEQKKVDHLLLRSIVENRFGNAWDLEDIVKALNDVRPTPLCPYFASTRSLTVNSDIIFCPFTYLLDPITRNGSDVDLQNSVVILDEAHNVEDVCRDSASFDFSEMEVLQSAASVAQKIDELQNHFFQASRTKAAVNFNEQNIGKADVLGDYLDALQAANEFLLKFLNFIKRLANSAFVKKTFHGNEFEYAYTFNWESLRDELASKETDNDASLLMPQKSSGFKQLESALCVFETKPVTGRERNSRKQEQEVDGDEVSQEHVIGKFKPSATALSCIAKFLCFSQYFNDDENYKFYKCNMKLTKGMENAPLSSSYQRKVSGVGNMSEAQHSFLSVNTPDFWNTSIYDDSSIQCAYIQPGFAATFSFWCMFPSIAFKDAFNQARSIILASGTLCPTETLRTELGVEFQEQMEGSQVISSDQIFACALSQGPTGQKLVATYKNISVGNDFMRELARIVVSICQIVSGGVLCFLSSYNAMESLHSTLVSREFSIDLQAKKRVFKEPKRNTELQAILDAYDSAIQNPHQHGTRCNGALMLAVYRGKMSEGVDFVDNKARCVICVGIPYPNTKNELVIQKKYFNDECRRTMQQYKHILSGDEWYITQGYRALNQALGRCLRHKDDWGALILIDERFALRAKTPEGLKISSWVRNELCHYNSTSSYFEFERDLRNFVDKMKRRFSLQ